MENLSMANLGKADFFSTLDILTLYNRLNTSFEVVASELYVRAVDFVKSNNLVDEENVVAEILNNYDCYIDEYSQSNPKLKSVIEVIYVFHEWKEARINNDAIQTENHAMDIIFCALNACQFSATEKGNLTGKSKITPKELVRKKAIEMKANNKKLTVAGISIRLEKLIKDSPSDYGFKTNQKTPKAGTLQNKWINSIF
jgi:hypothetical protein